MVAYLTITTPLSAEGTANVAEMAPRARMTPAETAKVTAYLVAAREAAP